MAAWRARNTVKHKVEGNIKEQFKVFIPWVNDITYTSDGKHINDTDEMLKILNQGDLP